ncbi:hydrogen peroxide-inducible genes activator [Thalassococcus sp. S3]|uniref:hydrogen peroxide-inducible genes activator n=1 Tax=Thalassococcus sp. S3 TaxID=2017482 RepID=UPI0010242338|nr:hydrogen peroxide-inducible genes activator [Thalassococcus sp. S3]QBF32519.1 LysR family transcriptional regulator [Thalassococcus sp. S3]
MINVTIKHLRYFDALARHGHFGRAAEACAITQPAMSIQIKELETMLGSPLVERGPRQVRLTPLGEDFAERARDILRSVDELSDLARAADGPLIGRLRVGVIPTVAPYLLPEVIKSLSGRFPSLDLQPREAKTERLIEDLLESRLDLAIVALPISEPALREFALFEEDFVLVRPSEEVGMPIPSPEGLLKMRLLLLEEGHCFRDQALSFCEATPTATRNLMEGSSLSTLVQMVGAGIGVTLIPEMAMPLETQAAQVSVARFKKPSPSRTIGMVWRKTTPLSDQLMEIGGIVRRVGTATRDAARLAG